MREQNPIPILTNNLRLSFLFEFAEFHLRILSDSFFWSMIAGPK